MIDFEGQTAVEGNDGIYRATIHSDLATPLGPYGAYIAGIGLRAAGAHTEFKRPASLTCHYLKPSKFGDVALEVQSLRRAKRAESIRVSMKQDGETVYEMLVWTVAELPGLEHEISMPKVPAPSDVRPFEEIFDMNRQRTLWTDVLEGRPIFDDPPDKDPPWSNKDFKPGPPVVRDWMRLRGRDAFDDPFVEAARRLLPIDWSVSSAAFRPHQGEYLWLPTMELTAAFHNLEARSDWMLADCESPFARGGFTWGDAKIWSEDGHMMATGAQLMLQRQVTPPD